MAVTQLRVLGGAVARVPSEATAYAHRDQPHHGQRRGDLRRAAERPEHEAWVADLARRLDDGDSPAYVGFLGDEGEERIRAAYPGTTYDRLAAVKARYDPDNVFRLNQNVLAGDQKAAAPPRPLRGARSARAAAAPAAAARRTALVLARRRAARRARRVPAEAVLAAQPAAASRPCLVDQLAQRAQRQRHRRAHHDLHRQLARLGGDVEVAPATISRM